MQKSSIIFGAKVPPDIEHLNIEKEGSEDSYLQLLECFSGLKRKLLIFQLEKLEGPLKGWFSEA